MQYFGECVDYFQTFHIFRDPIDGFIKIHGIERKIIDSRWFQRLRNIKQLGTTYLIYPSANHTRFEHSIGTMHLASRILENIYIKDHSIIGDKILNWDEGQYKRNWVLLRLATLLHDIGHSPFSHSAETLFVKGIKHEHYTSEIY